MSYTKYLRSSPCGVWEDFAYKENQWPWGGANFDPRAKIWTSFVEFHQTMFHVQYVSSSLYDSGGEDFLKFFLFIAMAIRVLHGIDFFEQLWEL